MAKPATPHDAREMAERIRHPFSETAAMLESLADQIENKTSVIRDMVENIQEVRQIAKRHISAEKVDGDSYGVPSIVDIVEMLADQLERERDEADICRAYLKKLLSIWDECLAAWKGTEEPVPNSLLKMACCLNGAKEMFLSRHQPAEQQATSHVSEPDGYGGYNTWSKGAFIEIPKSKEQQKGNR